MQGGEKLLMNVRLSSLLKDSKTNDIVKKYPRYEIRARILGVDMNVDGKEPWDTDSPFARILSMMNGKGYDDSWLLTDRGLLITSDTEASNTQKPVFTPDPGITYDDPQDGPQRLDYIWVASEQEIFVDTDTNESLMWQQTHFPLSVLTKGGKNIKRDTTQKRLGRMDRHSRRTLLSDHAALFATFRFCGA